MEKPTYSAFKELQKCFSVVVCEGEGTEDSPKRLFHYIFNENLEQIGIIDNWLAQKEK